MKITDEDVLSYHCSQDIPAGDASQGSEFSALLQTAARLADMWVVFCQLVCFYQSLCLQQFFFHVIRHQREADVVHQSSTDALNKSGKSLALLRTLMSNENKVKELIGDLKSMWVTYAWWLILHSSAELCYTSMVSSWMVAWWRRSSLLKRLLEVILLMLQSNMGIIYEIKGLCQIYEGALLVVCNRNVINSLQIGQNLN